MDLESGKRYDITFLESEMSFEWSDPQQASDGGYQLRDFFTATGVYLGPSTDGVYPCSFVENPEHTGDCDCDECVPIEDSDGYRENDIDSRLASNSNRRQVYVTYRRNPTRALPNAFAYIIQGPEHLQEIINHTKNDPLIESTALYTDRGHALTIDWYMYD